MSAEAANCPGCGHPAKKLQRQYGWGFALLTFVGVMTILGVIGSNAPTPSQADSAVASASSAAVGSSAPESESTDAKSLNARVGFMTDYVRVDNHDSFNWTNCDLTINRHSTGVFSHDGFTTHRDVIPTGQPTIIEQNEFADSAGARFDWVTYKLDSIYIYCDVPSGHMSYLDQ